MDSSNPGFRCQMESTSAFSIPHVILGMLQTNQSHHEVWFHKDFVEQRNGRAHHDANSTPHTSHFLVFHSTHFNVTLTWAQEQGVWRALHTCVIFMRSCCVVLDSLRLSLLLFVFQLLSHLPFHCPDRRHLPCGGQEPCALRRVRTLASWQRTILSQVTSPTTSTSQRPLKDSSRGLPATTGPQICMILNSMITPSAWRIVHPGARRCSEP